MKLPRIPVRTASQIANPAGNGERHKQAINIAISLIGNGLSASATFAQLRSMYDETMPDAEIEGVIKWAVSVSPTPSSKNVGITAMGRTRPARVTAQSAVCAAHQFLKGHVATEADLFDLWCPPGNPDLDASTTLTSLFAPEELVNVCLEFGPGITKTRNEWLVHLQQNGVPSGSIGCLFRFNPISIKPTGPSGGYTDRDVTAYRFTLLESDILPPDLQLAVISRLPLPIAAIIFSGGKSYHAIIRVGAPDALAYRKNIAKMLALLGPLGFDQATGNPSRMSRLPGAVRTGQRQRLVYLNPGANCERPILGSGS